MFQIPDAPLEKSAYVLYTKMKPSFKSTLSFDYRPLDIWCENEGAFYMHLSPHRREIRDRILKSNTQVDDVDEILNWILPCVFHNQLFF